MPDFLKYGHIVIRVRTKVHLHTYVVKLASRNNSYLHKIMLNLLENIYGLAAGKNGMYLHKTICSLRHLTCMQLCASCIYNIDVIIIIP